MKPNPVVDDALLAVAQQCGSIDMLLDSFFSFLKRHTDFYVVSDPKQPAEAGFPPGVAEAMVARSFRKFESDEVVKAPTHDQLVAEVKRKEKNNAAAETMPQKQQQQQQEKKDEEKKNDDNGGGGEKQQTQPTATQPPSSSAPPPPPSNKKEAINHFSTHNGGNTKSYAWNQSLEEAAVQIDMCQFSNGKKLRAKDLEVVLKKKFLSVTLKGGVLAGNAEAVTCVRGDLHGDIVVDDFSWNLEDGRFLQLSLTKVSPTWWSSILVGDTEIDTSHDVDSSRHVSEFDEETQAAIRKIIFDQNQKIKGLPTSDEIQNEELLRKAWNAEGGEGGGKRIFLD